jgi:hypothetical protein
MCMVAESASTSTECATWRNHNFYSQVHCIVTLDFTYSYKENIDCPSSRLHIKYSTEIVKIKSTVGR